MSEPIVQGPPRGFVGQEIDLVAEYQPSSDVTKVTFEVTSEDGTVLIVKREEFSASPARLRWSIEVPKGTQLPTRLKYRARIQTTQEEKWANLEVFPPPPMSLWVTHGFTPGAGITADMANGRTVIENMLDASRAPDGRQCLHDASLIATVAPQADPARVDWDRSVVSWLAERKHDAARRAHFEALVSICHSKGVKLLAGYEAAHLQTNVTHFRNFLSQATRQGKSFDSPDTQVITAHADALASFLLSGPQGLAWDGISLDIEIGEMNRRHAPTMRLLVQALADRFGLVAFAGLGYTAQFRGKDGMIIGWPDGKGEQKGPDGLPVGSKNEFFNSQPFELAQGKSNVLVRPMTYEGAPPDDKYVRDMMDWAYKPPPDGVGLQPNQLQIGFQIDPQPQAKKNPPGIMTDGAVQSLIRNELRKSFGGLVMWGLFTPNAGALGRFPSFDEAYRKKP